MKIARSGTCLLIFLFFSTHMAGQDVRLGVIGGLMTGIEERLNDAPVDDIRPVGSIQLDFRMQVDERYPFYLGATLGWGERTILNDEISEQVGNEQSDIGIERDLRVIAFGIPAAVLLDLTPRLSVGALLEGGYARIRVTEAIAVADAGSNAFTQQLAGEATGSAFYLVPEATLVYEMDIPFFLNVSAGYRFMSSDMRWEPQANIGPVLSRFVSQGTSSFDFGGMYFSAGIHYILFGEEEF